jgi:hypothetical protein
MKTFAVYSKDKALLKAFEQKLIEAGYKSDEDWNYHHRERSDKTYLHLYDKYLYHNHGENVETVYTLPEEWNKAVEELSIFEPGKWIKIDNPKPDTLTAEYIGRVGKIISPDCVPRANVHTVDIGSIHINVDEVEMRLASNDEIKDELITRSGLKIGDRVNFEEKGTHTVRDFRLVTSEADMDQSEKCSKYFKKVGVHLAVIDKPYSYPAALCTKEDSLIIDTDDGEKKVKYTGSHIEVGCEEISLGFLTNLEAVASHCDSNEYYITINRDGSILEFDTPNGKIRKRVSIETLRKILKKADQ